MKNRQSRAFLLKCLCIATVVIILGVLGWWYLVHTRSSAQEATAKDGMYFMNEYQDPADTDKCLKEYYDTYPEAKSENQAEGVVTLAPPCPGVPQ